MHRHSTTFWLAAVPGFAVVCLGDVVLTQEPASPNAAALQNPVAATPQSLAAGKKAYDENCAACHGPRAEGSVKAGVIISIIQEQGGRQPPDLTDAAVGPRLDRRRDLHGHQEGRAADDDGRVGGADLGHRDLAASSTTCARSRRTRHGRTGHARRPGRPTAAAPTVPKPALQLADYAQLPITGDLDGKDTRGELARVNFLRDEPGGRRFFVNDLNGPLYILDKRTKAFTTYLDFNGADGRPGLFARLTFQRNFATGLINVVFDPDYPRNGVFYTIHMEDPTIDAPAEPKSGVVPGLDLSGYTTTPAARDAGRARLPHHARSRDRRVDRSQRRQRDVRRHGARAVPDAARVAHPSAGRADVQSGRPPRRSRVARHVRRRRGQRQRRAARHPPLQPAAARQLQRQDPAHRAGPARPHRDQHGERERALSHPERQSLRRPSTVRARRSGPRACAIRTA